MKFPHSSLLALALAVFSGEASAFCDPQLKPEPGTALGYSRRGDDARCEGIYQQPPAGASLEIAALLLAPLDFDSAQDPAVQVTSPRVNLPVLVRAIGIPNKSYYRLDAELKVGATFTWPLEILAQTKLRADNVGVFGRLQSNPDIYVPLQVSRQGETAPSRRGPVLLLRAAETLSTVNWRYAEAVNGQCQKMQNWLTLDAPRGFRGGQPIPVPLPKAAGSQLCVEVAAHPRFGKEWLQQLWRIQVGD